MTMQIGVRAGDGSIVLASDTKSRVQGAENGKYTPLGIISHSKIVLSRRHDLALAFAGYNDAGTAPRDELAEELSWLGTMPDNLGPILKEWGINYHKAHASDSPDFSVKSGDPFPKTASTQT